MYDRPGDSKSKLEDLTEVLESLDPDDYPSGASNFITADGVPEPLLAFLYDALSIAVGAAEAYGESNGMPQDE